MVVVLFARRDSIYKSMGLDCYDSVRDARTYNGSDPVIAHPPCRQWGRYAFKAGGSLDEKELARFAVSTVRRCGGVLEHPYSSSLWRDQSICRFGTFDVFGGFTVRINQSDFGHMAQKDTILYVVRADLPPFTPCPLPVLRPLEHLSKAQREHTPPYLATWLCQIAATAHYS